VSLRPFLSARDQIQGYFWGIAVDINSILLSRIFLRSDSLVLCAFVVRECYITWVSALLCHLTVIEWNLLIIYLREMFKMPISVSRFYDIRQARILLSQTFKLSVLVYCALLVFSSAVSILPEKSRELSSHRYCSSVESDIRI
jgi:hypothetical protein